MIRFRWGALALIAVVAGCASTGPGGEGPEGSASAASSLSGSPSPSASPSVPAPSSSGPSSATPSTGPAEVMVIAEENHTYDEVFGAGRAPYLTRLASEYATITGMDAGYPPSCPSLPAYLLMTSGSTHGVCDDAGPDAHPIGGPSIFSEVESAGLQWRGYAEGMPGPCARNDAAAGRYLVRHAPAPYYTSLAAHCPSWDLPLGTPAAGALHDDVAAGRLPAYAFVTPDACDDMHGARAAPATWSPRVTSGCPAGCRRSSPGPTTGPGGSSSSSPGTRARRAAITFPPSWSARPAAGSA